MTAQQTSDANRVYVILDEIRNDIGAVKTDIAVLASNQPAQLQLIHDHESRIRDLEQKRATTEKLAGLEARVDEIEGEIHKNAWVGRIATVATTATVTGVIAWIVQVWLGSR